MHRFLWQKELRRGRRANRLGLALLVLLLLVLVASFLNGVRSLNT